MSRSTLPVPSGKRTAAQATSHTEQPSHPVLSPDLIERESEEQLLNRGAAYAREYDAINGKQTTLLKNVAVVLVELRRRSDDWLGRSHEYRQLAASLYSRSGIPSDSQAAIQAAVRWHIGNHLRTVVSPAELAGHDLKIAGPAEREKTARQSRNAIVMTARAELESSAKARKTSKKSAGEPNDVIPAPASYPVADHLRLGRGAHDILSQLSASVVDDMTDGQRAKLDDELEQIQKVVAKLRRHTKKRSSEG
ncbi:hypothetical protein OTB20_08420 [Streptomyces sp. H27-H1]|uniref:hypothetical protein n=1 Tax=Streptomyces sp. H27-H1 TaxID=2996461 RepID=UPI00226F8312|nr:hypothetical protein [Streptomyces sp. H27-H1]MCY0926229.1 hypothetical protein [Streptomyces sp. H27-H1]